jgi:superfamily II DNA helicase RecQ
MACCFNYSQEWFEYFVHGINIPVLDDVAVPTIESRNVAVQPSLPVQIRTRPPDVDVHDVKATTIPPLKEFRDHEADIGRITTVLAALQVLYPCEETSRFRSVEQRDMLVSSLRALDVVEDHLFIIRTGGGKTACLGACALMERQMKTRRVTVAIVPLISLCEDLARQFKKTGLVVTVCSSAISYSAATSNEVLILLPEVADSSLMFQLLQRLDAEGRLGAIWFDEFHLYFTWFNFRPVMMNFLQKCAIFEKSPRLMVTGTFPPAMQQLLCVHGSLANSCVSRSVTNRPDVHYLRTIVESSVSDSLPLVMEAVKIAVEVIKSVKAGSRLIVTCTSYTDVNSVLDALRQYKEVTVLRYDGSMSEDEKQESYSNWTDMAASVVMVATSAFGIGTTIHDDEVLECDGEWFPMLYPYVCDLLPFRCFLFRFRGFYWHYGVGMCIYDDLLMHHGL